MFSRKKSNKPKLRIKNDFIFFDDINSDFNSRLNIGKNKGDIEILSHQRDEKIRGEKDEPKNGINVDEVHKFLKQHYTEEELKIKNIWMTSCSSLNFARNLSLKTKGIVYGTEDTLFQDLRYNGNFVINSYRYFVYFVILILTLIILFAGLLFFNFINGYYIFSFLSALMIIILILNWKNIFMIFFKLAEKTGTKKFIGYSNGIKLKD